MGLVLAPSEVRGYIGYMKGYLSASMQCYTDTKQKVEDYVADNELLSVAWEQSKETMHVCYQAIVSEMLSVQDNFLSDLDTLDGAVGDEYLNEDQLLARIERLEEECRQYTI